ncbi:predicted protein [Aspergillus terreus NIH2624]|uniref:Uncharacterized protein n=1 Tax=Aspergillus terreus (strain NIH 2624 / FGSC A1156) TaxID=341663 RepID=Q0CBJ5_ASPTN|nr:uncharacterized protein ATEG_08939 [Aspergillus terreus NIH2624]EAU31071.1 predicted protein [Aspergillus terreus NIH2624]
MRRDFVRQNHDDNTDHHAEPELDQTFVYYEEYDPSYPAPVVFRWEGCAFDDSSDAFNDVVEAFTAMLRFSNSVRVIEISQAHGLCPEWVQVSREEEVNNFGVAGFVKMVDEFPTVVDGFMGA